MRRGLVVLFVVVALVLVALGFVRIDLGRFRELLTQRISEAAGRRVEVGGLSLRLLPLPFVEVRDLVVAGSRPDAPPLIRARRIDLRPHLWPLLTRRRYVATVELHEPVVHLGPGRPELPPVPIPGEIPVPPGEGKAPAEGEAPPVVIRALRITGGAVEWGDVRAEAITVDGRLDEDGSAWLELEADVPGITELRDVEIRYGPIGAERPAADLRGRIVEADLGAIGRTFLDRDDLAGRLSGTFEVALAGPEPTRISVRAEARGVVVGDLDLRLDGGLELEGERGGEFRADLTGLALELGDVLRKRARRTLIVRGAFPAAFPPERVDGVVVELPGFSVPGSVDLSGASPSVTVGPSKVSLEVLAGLQPEPLSVLGTLEVERALMITLDPPAVRGDVLIDLKEISLRGGRVEVVGRIEGRGAAVSSRDLRIRVWTQPFEFETTYGLRNGILVAEGGTEGADVQALGRAFLGRDELSGTLRAKGRFQVPVPPGAGDPVRAARADVRIEITEGRIRGFSLAKQLLGELATLPLLVAAIRGKDLSRYEEEEFRELSGDFRLRDGVLRTDNLLLRYRYATARLHGSVALPEGTLDLTGKVTLAREMDAELGGGSRARERVIPIAGIRGTVTKPRIVLDRSALLAIAEVYAGQDRVRERLEEKLGPGGAEAVEGILDLLRGGGKGR